MKKLVILLLLVIGIFPLVSAQGYHHFDQSRFDVYGFDGKKPLKKDKKVEVVQTTSNGTKIFWEYFDAKKGETEESFLKRFNKDFVKSKAISIVKPKNEKEQKK